MSAELPLLAKSTRAGLPPVTLFDHCVDTERAALGVFKPGSRWLRAWLRFFKLGVEHEDRFLLHLRVASLFHDIGKANADFLQAVSSAGVHVQALRHEHLSAWLLYLPSVRAWLSGSALDLDVIASAVLCHHLKAGPRNDKRAWGQPNGRSVVRLLLDHPQVYALLARVGALAQVAEAAPQLPASPWRDTDALWLAALRAGYDSADEIALLDETDPRRRLLLALKAGVIVSDSVSSGLVREGHDIEAWLDEHAHRPQLASGEVDAAIIAPRARSIENRSGRKFELQRFQIGAGELGPRALLLAACGAGKTLAAWKWIERQTQAREVGRAVFLYPTRGTATEGFRDYVGWAPETDAALVHGTSRYELEAMRANPAESTDGKRLGLSEAEARLFALALWSRRYFSATVDQFLGFLEHAYGSMCLLPVLADAVIVLDEVHSYDRQMFQALLSFLDHFDVPVLAMTATLPPARRDDLVARGLQVYPSADDRALLEDLEREETRPRYALESVGGEAAALERVIGAVKDGRSVLWVVNQVAICQRVAALLEERLSREVLCYHSRFKLSDRQQIHARLVEAFKSRGSGAVAVTTQVCEMSLDLDADVLVSEEARPTALVQRFGRSNRSRTNPSSHRGQLVTYPPLNALPYEGSDLSAARKMLGELRGLGRELSQRDLAEALERASAEPHAHSASSFVGAGFYAVPGILREDGPPSASAVLDTDLPDVLAALRSRAPIDGFVVPVPLKQVVERDDGRPPALPRYLEIAPGALYDPARGFVVEGTA